jgi:tetratricopeptide (TPR) repeat protein
MEQMREDRAEDMLRKGVELFKQGETLGALPLIEKSFEIEQSPTCRSYVGLLRALERGQINEGLALCTKAIDEDSENPLFYFNLGRVLYKAGMKREAIDTVRKGLACGHYEEAEAWLDDLGIRKKPVFPFIRRNSFLNKYLGIIFSRLGLR